MPAMVEDEERVSYAKSIFIGQVTGIRHDEDERNLKYRDRGFSIQGLGTYYTLRVFVTSTLKGRPKKILSIPICSCGCGGASLSETAVVFKYRDGSYYVSDDEETIATVKKALGK